MKKIIIYLTFTLLLSLYLYSQNISLRSLSGKYKCINGHIESEIEIIFIENDKFYIEGFAISTVGGHSHGLIEKSLAYYDRNKNKIIYKDEYGYILEASIIDTNRLYIKDNAISKSYFGMGVSFEGNYNRINLFY